jgi:lipid II:glycine glycyltransferase (peptidoglycan interpeptide bridge formation enzyme)
MEDVMNLGGGRSVQIRQYLDKMRRFEEDPVNTFTDFAELSIELNEAYGLACEELRETKLSQKTFEAQQRSILSRKSDTNLLTQEGISLTKTNIDAYIKNMESWQVLQEKIDELLDHKQTIQGVREIVHGCMTYISHNQLLKARASTNNSDVKNIVRELMEE